MKLERTQNAKRNITYGMLNKIVTLLLPFFVRMVMIRTLGIEYVGLSSLFSSVLQLLNLTEMGFSIAAVYSMYKPIAEDDTEKICALLNYYRDVYRKIAAVVFLIGILLVPLLPYLIKGDTPNNVNIYVLYGIYLSNTVLTYAVFAYRTAILNAYQRVDIISIVSVVTTGAMYLLQIITLLYFENYYVYIIVLPISTLAGNIIRAWLARRAYPDCVCAGALDRKTRSKIRRQISGLMINKICQSSRNSFDSIFVSAFLGLSIAGIYSNYYMILNAVNGLLAVFMESITAGIGNSMALDSCDKNYMDMRRINFIYMWIAGWCTICMFCLYQPFVKIAFGKDNMFSFRVVALFCLYFYALCMGNVRGTYADAAGLWWQNRYRAIAESVVNVVLNFLFAYRWGVEGIIVATLIPLLIINFGYGSQIVFQCYFKNNKLKEYFLLHGKYAIVTLLVGSVTYLLSTLIPGDGFIQFAEIVTLCVIVPNILYWILYHHTKEYADVLPWQKRILFHK